MKDLGRWTKLFLGMVAFSVAGSFLSSRTGLDPGPIKPVASLLTIAFGVLALSKSIKLWQLLSVVAIGATAELVGLFTGFPFGEYEYTKLWWPTIPLKNQLHFPLLLPFAWFLVAGGSVLAVRQWGKAALILAPLLATGIDVLMEPVMTRKLGYWYWVEGGPLPGSAPWTNVLGWLGISFLATLIMLKGSGKAQDAVWVLGGYLLLMAGLWFA